MQIDALRLDNPFILAPLAGYTDLAFRLLCREFGAAMCFSEMTSSHGLAFHQGKTLQLTRTVAAERPVVLQLFGAKPDIMGEAAAMISDLPIDMIDINMGCPVKKVVKSGAGAALMRTPELAAEIIRQVCRNTRLPVSVKIRSGWTQETVNAVDFAKMAADAGARAVSIHGRTWAQGFSGRADWRIIGRVKQAVFIPVIGNGDIRTYNDGLALMAETGCDGVMIGRAALGNPWVFHPDGPPATLSLRMAGLRRHLELARQYQQVDQSLARIKNHAGRYFKEIPGGSAVRRRIYEARTFTELQELAETGADNNPGQSL
jgi:tRNA-dihydrouridine synthase B